MTLHNSNSVELQFPKHCTPDNISLFSGFMATIPHLMAPLAKERYNIDVRDRFGGDNAPVANGATKGQQLTHSIFLATRQNFEPMLVEESLSSAKRPISISTTPTKPARPPPFIQPRKKTRYEYRNERRRRLTPEKKREKRIRYANAISAWDRAKRKDYEGMSSRTSFEGSISDIIQGVCVTPPSVPPKWRPVLPAYMRTTATPDFPFGSPSPEEKIIYNVPAKHEEESSFCDLWDPFNFTSLEDSPLSHSLSWLTGDDMERSFTPSSGSSIDLSSCDGPGGNSSVVNGLLKDWFS